MLSFSAYSFPERHLHQDAKWTQSWKNKTAVCTVKAAALRKMEIYEDSSHPSYFWMFEVRSVYNSDVFRNFSVWQQGFTAQFHKFINMGESLA